VPVPVTVAEAVEFAALLRIVTPPLAAPVAPGAKVILNDVLCPGFNTTPLDTPVAVNPAPETVTCDNVTVAVPVFERLNVCAELAATFTLPNAKLAGVNESWPCAVAAGFGEV